MENQRPPEKGIRFYIPEDFQKAKTVRETDRQIYKVLNNGLVGSERELPNHKVLPASRSKVLEVEQEEVEDYGISSLARNFDIDPTLFIPFNPVQTSQVDESGKVSIYILDSIVLPLARNSQPSFESRKFLSERATMLFYIVATEQLKHLSEEQTVEHYKTDLSILKDFIERRTQQYDGQLNTDKGKRFSDWFAGFVDENEGDFGISITGGQVTFQLDGKKFFPMHRHVDLCVREIIVNELYDSFRKGMLQNTGWFSGESKDTGAIDFDDTTYRYSQRLISNIAGIRSLGELVKGYKTGEIGHALKRTMDHDFEQNYAKTDELDEESEPEMSTQAMRFMEFYEDEGGDEQIQVRTKRRLTD